MQRWVMGFVLWPLAVWGNSLRIEAYGDSLTAGMLSGTNLAEVQSLDSFKPILTDFAHFAIYQDRRYLERNERPHLAWPEKIGAWLADRGYEATVTNLGRSGAMTYSLKNWIIGDPKTTDLSWSFFFIGHNDLCDDEVEVEKFLKTYKQEYTEALTVWDEKHEGATAYLLPIGPMNQVYRTLDNFVWYETPEKKFSCNDSWRAYFPFCRSNYRRLKMGTLETFLEPRIQGMNQVLQQLVDEWSVKSSRNRYHYIPTAWPEKLTPEMFAVDCYHTSEQGQQNFANGVTKFLLRNRMIQ